MGLLKVKSLTKRRGSRKRSIPIETGLNYERWRGKQEVRGWKRGRRNSSSVKGP